LIVCVGYEETRYADGVSDLMSYGVDCFNLDAGEVVYCIKLLGGICMAIKGRRNRIKYLFIETAKSMYEEGKYKSKHIIMEENYRKYNIRETHLIHDYQTYTEYKDILVMFAHFLTVNCNIKYEKDFRKLSKEELYDCIDKYFEYLKGVEKLSQDTLVKHISALSKVLAPIRPEVTDFFIPENYTKWCDDE